MSILRGIWNAIVNLISPKCSCGGRLHRVRTDSGAEIVCRKCGEIDTWGHDTGHA